MLWFYTEYKHYVYHFRKACYVYINDEIFSKFLTKIRTIWEIKATISIHDVRKKSNLY